MTAMPEEIKTTIPIDMASVKVMRSYDYCHFEVHLTSALRNQIDTCGVIDELRKTAARLADKAVEQYKVAKRNMELASQDPANREYLHRRYEQAVKTPEDQRSPEEKAIIKKFQDDAYRLRPRYDYEDQWEEPDWKLDE